MNDVSGQRSTLIVTALAFAVVSVLVTLSVSQSNRAREAERRAAEAEAQVADLEREARTAANRARRARSQAGELVGFFTEGLRDQLAEIGRTDLLETAARRAEGYFEALPPGDIDIESDSNHAKMLMLRGWAHHNQGAHPESIEAFTAAVALLEPHFEADPKDGSVANTLAHLLNESSLPLRSAGRYDEAKAAGERALEIYQRLHEGDRETPRWLQGIALSNFVLGAVAIEEGHDEVGRDRLAVAAENAHRAHEMVPDDVNFRSLEMVSLTSKGLAEVNLGLFDEAEQTNGRAIEIADELISLQPSRRKWRKEKATIINNFGSALAEQDLDERATGYFERAHALRQEIVVFDPNNAAWRSDLANSEFNRAINSIKKGDLPEGWRRADDCFEQMAIMLRQEPDSAGLHENLKSFIRELSVAFRENDGLNESAKLYERAERLFAELAASEEGREENLFRRAEVLKIAAERRVDLDNLDSAALHFERAAEVLIQLHRQHPADPRCRYLLASAVANRAWVCELKEDYESALRFYQFAYALYAGVPEGFRNREKHMAGDARTIRRLKAKLGLIDDLELGQTLLPMGSEWRYSDAGVPAAESWQTGSFDDSAWGAGRAQFGYGDGDETTLVDFGPDPDHKHPTTYFRTSFDIENLGGIGSLHLALVRDDGGVVYLNGEEIARTMLPEGVISFNTFATDFTDNDVENEPEWFDFDASEIPLKQGINWLAVEIHQVDGASSDLSFDLEVQANAVEQDPLSGMDRAAFDAFLGTPAS